MDSSEICNMTPHAILIQDIKNPGEFVKIPPCGIVPRLESTAGSVPNKTLLGGRIQVVRPTEYDYVNFIFELHVTKTTPIIVSRMVAEYLRKIKFEWPGGVYSPDTGPESVIRNDSGVIVGVKRLEGDWTKGFLL